MGRPGLRPGLKREIREVFTWLLLIISVVTRKVKPTPMLKFPSFCKSISTISRHQASPLMSSMCPTREFLRKEISNVKSVTFWSLPRKSGRSLWVYKWD